MSQERRKHRRFACPLDGSWRGGSGGATCRIADISLGGCFVQTLSSPVPGERTVVTIAGLDGQPLSLPGVVIYPERGLGFAVRFVDVPPEAKARLEALIDDLSKKLPGA